MATMKRQPNTYEVAEELLMDGWDVQRAIDRLTRCIERRAAEGKQSPRAEGLKDALESLGLAKWQEMKNKVDRWVESGSRPPDRDAMVALFGTELWEGK